jgi:CheY-like chemotaxis protein
MSKKILVVDDMPSILNLLKLIIKKVLGYEVYTEESSIRAIERALAIQPDLMIIDLYIDTHMNGCDLVSEMRKHESLKNTPVVFYSGGFIDTDVTGYKRDTKCICVKKTTPMSEFIKIIRNLIEQKIDYPQNLCYI